MSAHTWTARVSSARRDEIVAHVRNHQFNVGAAVQFDHEYEQITALEYMLGAIGADVVSGLQSVARARRIKLDQVEAVVQGELNNPLVPLGVIGEVGHPGLQRVQVRVYVSTQCTEEQMEGVWRVMLAQSPLVRTFNATIELDLSLKVTI